MDRVDMAGVLRGDGRQAVGMAVVGSPSMAAASIGTRPSSQDREAEHAHEGGGASELGQVLDEHVTAFGVHGQTRVQRLGLEARHVGLDGADDPDQGIDVEQVEALEGHIGPEAVAGQRGDLRHIDEPERVHEATARILGRVDEHRALLGVATSPGAPLEGRVLVPRGGELRLDLLDHRVGLVGQPDGATDGAGLLFPGHPVVDVLVGLGDRRRDLRQGLVVAVGQAAVHGEDQIRGEGGDLLEVDRAGVADQHGHRRVTELVLRPRPHRPGMPSEPLRGAHRYDAEGEQRASWSVRPTVTTRSGRSSTVADP